MTSSPDQKSWDTRWFSLVLLFFFLNKKTHKMWVFISSRGYLLFTGPARWTSGAFKDDCHQSHSPGPERPYYFMSEAVQAAASRFLDQVFVLGGWGWLVGFCLVSFVFVFLAFFGSSFLGSGAAKTVSLLQAHTKGCEGTAERILWSHRLFQLHQKYLRDHLALHLLRLLHAQHLGPVRLQATEFHSLYPCSFAGLVSYKRP